MQRHAVLLATAFLLGAGAPGPDAAGPPTSGVMAPPASGRVDPHMPVVHPRAPARTPVIRPRRLPSGGGRVDPR
jgi:hypothetical protein